MEYVKFGNTGMEVSRLAVGCMSFGEPSRGSKPWVLPEEESRVMIKKALDLGLNFFDTANVYSDGSSEEIVGRALRDYANRDEIVVATKVFFNESRQGPNSSGLSRKVILSEIDHSLERLGMDYVDLYIIHRWDEGTPIEETMEALHEVVKSGKARYIGASSMHSWQFSKAQYTAQLNGWTKFVSMQNMYNLINREEEREMLPLCRDQQVAVTPWSPLARGRLTRPWTAKTKRSGMDENFERFFPEANQSDQVIVQRIEKLANELGVSMAQVALAWVLNKEVVTSPIIGATKLAQLEDCVAAIDLQLTKKQTDFLEEAYVPHNIVGYK